MSKGSLLPLLSILFFITTWASIDEKRLLKRLFDEKRRDAHNILERPTVNESQPLVLHSKFTVNKIMDVDEKNQILTSIIWAKNTWQDNHFIWNPDEYGGIKTLNLAPNMIWKPDLLLYNCVDESFDRFHHSNVIVKYNGEVTWYPLGLFRSICTINILWFPFDSQVCKLKFGTWSHTGGQITFRIPCKSGEEKCGDEQAIETVENGEFNIYSITVQRNEQKYDCCPDIYEDVQIRIKFQRRALYYIFNLALPCMLISGMSLMVFMLPPDAGEKISLGVTILLSLTMFLQLVADKLPQTSESIPLISIYFSCTMLLCSFSIVFTILVLSFHHMWRFDDGVPKYIKIYINVYLAKMVFLTPRQVIIPDRDDSSLSSKSTLERGDSLLQPPPPYPYRESSIENTENFRPFALGNPKMDKKSVSPRQITRLSKPNYVQSSSGSSTNDIMNEKIQNNNGPSQKLIEEALCYYKPDLQRLLNELKLITKNIREEAYDSQCSNEWKFAARVVDRFCLILFTIANIILIITVVSSAPNLSRSFIVSNDNSTL